MVHHSLLIALLLVADSRLPVGEGLDERGAKKSAHVTEEEVASALVQKYKEQDEHETFWSQWSRHKAALNPSNYSIQSGRHSNQQHGNKFRADDSWRIHHDTKRHHGNSQGFHFNKSNHAASPLSGLCLYGNQPCSSKQQDDAERRGSLRLNEQDGNKRHGSFIGGSQQDGKKRHGKFFSKQKESRK